MFQNGGKKFSPSIYGREIYEKARIFKKAGNLWKIWRNYKKAVETLLERLPEFNTIPTSPMVQKTAEKRSNFSIGIKF